MEITAARLPTDTNAIIDFVASRNPKQDLVNFRSDLNVDTAWSLKAVVAREHNHTLSGFGLARAASNLPAGAVFVIVITRRDLGGQGVARRLFAAVLADIAEDVSGLVTCVMEGDQTSLDVARHWGFQTQQVSVTTSVALADAPKPEARPGVIVEVCDELSCADHEAVEAMLLASQTNPEAELGLMLTLASLRDSVAPRQRPVAVLTRCDGHPAAMSFGIADGEQMHVVYTGVDPAWRGRGLGRLTKQFLHAHARDVGVRLAFTSNEEGNTGIRHINDQLGYTHHSSWHWLMRPTH